MTTFNINPAPIKEPPVVGNNLTQRWVRWFQEVWKIPQLLASAVTGSSGASLIGLSAITGLVATDVQAGLAELQGDITELQGGREKILFIQTNDVTVANTTTETTLLGTLLGSKTIPANLLAPGSVLRITAQGRLSDTGTPSVNIKVKLGTTVAIETGPVPLTGTVADDYWEINVLIGVRTIGGAGTAVADGKFMYDNANNSGKLLGLTGASSIALDTSIDDEIDITATWSAASASNTITANKVFVELLNI